MTARAQFVQLGELQIAPPISLLECARKGGSIDRLREVEEGAGYGGDRDSIDDRSVRGREIGGAMDVDAGWSGVASRDKDVRGRTAGT